MIDRLVLATALAIGAAAPAAAEEVLTGAAAFGGFENDRPGLRRLIRPEDLPEPFATPSASNAAGLVERGDRAPAVPEGFEVALFADGLDGPRTLAVAPNGDVFVAESAGNRIHVFRAEGGAATPTAEAVFADGLDYPYGIAFYPPGPEPEFVYVASEGSVVRFPYKAGDMEARGPAETVVADIPTGGHATRGLAVSADGSKIYVAVGSASNVGRGMPARTPEQVAEREAQLGLGAAWGDEEGRAAVLAFDPDGKNGRLFSTGLRNCSGLALQPATGAVWCAVNERDGLGDNLVPDYVTRVRDGAFYGWPWYYIGDREDPRHAGVRPDLAGKVTVPDVLLQAHSAPLGLAFYEADAFPSEYRGDGFATLHGSWNRSLRTGYKVVRIPMKDGVPTGEYEDFMTGFAVSGEEVWGRPTGVAVMADGSLLVSEDGNGTIWRVTHQAGG
jgi:glucose/arabinose dehydrogenase